MKEAIENLTSEVVGLLSEVHSLREDVRRSKVYNVLLAIALVATLGLGVAFVVGYNSSRDAARAGNCTVLNEGIARDEKGAISLGAAASKSNDPRTQQPYTEDGLVELREGMYEYMATLDLGRIDCAAYVIDPDPVVKKTWVRPPLPF